MAFAHGKDGRLYVNGVDLTGYMTAATASRNRDKAETTTFGAVNKTWLPAPGDSGLSGEGLFDNSVGAIIPTLDALFAQTTDSVWSLVTGGDAIGGRSQCLAGQQDSYEITNDVGDAVKVTLGVFGSLADGCVTLRDKATNTTTFTGSAVDLGTGGTLGGRAFLHVFAGSGTGATLTAAVQHSADGSTGWANLITFSSTAGTAAPVAKVAASAGNAVVNRYVRVLGTIAGTTPSFTWWLGFAVNR